MGRGRGKGKKVNHHEDLGSGGEEKKQQPVRKRGRPVKPAKEEDDEIENDANKVAQGLEDGGDNAKGDTTISSKDTENVGPDDLKRVPVVGYRHNGSRRKNKPRRAAEVGVECSWTIFLFPFLGKRDLDTIDDNARCLS